MININRDTWGKAAKEDLPGVRVIFVLGVPSGRSQLQVRIVITIPYHR